MSKFTIFVKYASVHVDTLSTQLTTESVITYESVDKQGQYNIVFQSSIRVQFA